jgi:hypothetical protein
MTPAVKALPPDLRLDKGSHEPPNGEFAVCLLEAVSYVAGERWTDHPECVCPVLAAFGRSWNDSLNDEDRQMLVPYIPRLVGTRSTPQVEEARAWMATEWLVRECAPTWLRLAGLEDHAHALEHLAAVTSPEAARAGQERIRDARSGAYAAWDAAWDAAWAAGAAARDAAGAAAWDAAWAAGAAARDAAGAAAWAAGAAARDAAGAAAEAAAGAAAWAAWAAAEAAAGDAARDAAWDALRPTVKSLQVSALALLDRMIEAA